MESALQAGRDLTIAAIVAKRNDSLGGADAVITECA